MLMMLKVLQMLWILAMLGILVMLGMRVPSFDQDAGNDGDA